MPDTSSKILKQCATELENMAAYLMKNRAVLEMSDLNAGKTRLLNLRATMSAHLPAKQLQKVDANMDIVEDILDGLIRQIKFKNHTGKNFTSDVRELSSFLRVVASLIWSLTAILFSIHTHIR